MRGCLRCQVADLTPAFRRSRAADHTRQHLREPPAASTRDNRGLAPPTPAPLDAAEHVLESFEVAEEIRPFAPEELAALVNAHGFSVDETWWDYTLREPPPTAQFFTVVAHAR